MGGARGRGGARGLRAGAAQRPARPFRRRRRRRACCSGEGPGLRSLLLPPRLRLPAGPVSRCRWDPVSSPTPSTMPPKKGGDGIKPPPIIGRFGTSLKIGIVGLPNVGKSTFFNVLTNSQASAENFPFCTIDPNESRVPVPDERFDFLCQYHKPASKIPAFLNVVDIAGLVKGAHNGQGLGNAFLSHISACDGIFHLTRAFEDDDITHVEGSVDPIRDIEIIHEELQLKDEEMVGPIIDKLEKVAVRGGDKKLKPEYDIMCKVKSWVIDQKKPVRFYHDWNDKEIEVLNKHLFLTSKPMVYLVNLSEKDYIRKKNKWLIKIKEWVDKYDPGALVIPFSGALELKLQELSAEERQKYLEANMTQSALPKIIKAGFAALQLEYFFTAGPDEVRAWTIRKGTKAPQAAGKIHTDFEKGFIMAEVMKYEDFKEEGSENAVKAAGKYRQQGRNYIVEDGDIIFFKFNTPQQPKKK
nr:obg-like ATPase 1 isoform X1 [Microcebus murinus]